jgi:hypothetical protein
MSATASFPTPDSDFASTNVRFATYSDPSKGLDPCYKIPTADEGTDKWNAEGQLPVTPVMWAELHGHGNRDGKYPPAPGNEEFTLKLSVGGDYKDVYPDHPDMAEGAAAAAVGFANDLLALEEGFIKYVWANPLAPLDKFKSECVSGATKSFARARGVKKSDFTAADKSDVDADALERFRVNYNPIVKTNADGVKYFKAKSRVMQRRDGVPTYISVPVFGAGDTTVPLNCTDNDTELVNYQSVVGGTVRLRPYVIASGKFGIRLQLLDVVKVMDRASSGKKRKARVDYASAIPPSKRPCGT